MRAPYSAPLGTSDSGYAERAAKGDSEAWAKLVEKYSAYVAAIIRSCQVPEPDQADAFQHVFIELYKGLDGLRNTDNLAPWLRQAAVRHCVRLRKKLGRTSTLGEASDAELLADPVLAGAELEQAEEGLIVQQAVDALSDKCRQLIKMLFYEDPPRPYTEAAAQLGLQVGSLGMTRARCLEALQKELASRGIP